MNILALNVGSSSLKFRLFRIAVDAYQQTTKPLEEEMAAGGVERVGSSEAKLKLTLKGQQPVVRAVGAASTGEAVEKVIHSLIDPNEGFVTTPFTIDAVAHRIVHGGLKFFAPTRIDATVEGELKQLAELAPLHNPAGLAGIDAGLKVLPDRPAIAVFDTGFHHDMPAVAARYALPLDLTERYGLRRFGFHGISYRYVSESLFSLWGREAHGTRVIICHLGNGASVCALRDGKSIDTSMGFTPLEGLVMGTRSGDIDPGLVLHLIHKLHISSEEMDDMLNHKSGLLGLSGESGDVRDLEKAAQHGAAHAEEALGSFAYRVRKYIGAYAAALEGLDALVFTGGIGERSVSMRSRICRGLEFLGLTLDAHSNTAATGAEPMLINVKDKGTPIWVIPTDEELQIARDTFHLLNP